MKYFVIVFIFCIAAFQVKGQSWAVPGATWYYDFFSAHWANGYVKIEKTGDTVILGKTCDILYKTRKSFRKFPDSIYSEVLGREYTYENNKVVYNYRYGKFYVLYNFNAKPGDTWEAVPSWKGCSDSTTVTRTDSVGWTIINGDSLKVLWTSPLPSSQYGFSSYGGKIIEKIGPTGYMLPEQICTPDGSQGGPLRCYSDSSGWNYSTGYAPSCEFILTGINENISSLKKAIIYPNPSSGNTKIIFPSSFYLENKELIVRISTITGAEIISFKTSDDSFDLFENNLSSGVYFYSIEQATKGTFLQRGKFIIQ